MTNTTPVLTKETYTLPAGTYVIGCPSLLTYSSDEMDDAFLKDGLGQINGHHFISVSTGMDGSFTLYDLEDSEHSGEPEEVDEFVTDIARMAIIPKELIPDYDDALEYGREFVSYSTDNEGNETPDPVEVKIIRDTANHNSVMEIDIEWYKLVIWNQKLFGGVYGEEA